MSGARLDELLEDEDMETSVTLVRKSTPPATEAPVPARSHPPEPATPVAEDPIPTPVPAPAQAASPEPTSGSAPLPEPPSPAPPPEPAAPPARGPIRSPIPGYEVLEELGRGGMAMVFRARQTSLDRQVALKVLSPLLGEDEPFVRRFEREAKILAALDHKNVVRVFDRGRTGDRCFYAMELVDGRSLREILDSRQGPLPPAEALGLMLQLAEALAYVHSQGALHRDVKPANLLVTEDGIAKLADFGLVVDSDRLRDNLTRTGVGLGTLDYMPIEQRQDARSVDQRADVYAFGVTLYETLVGHVPSIEYAAPSRKIEGLDPRLDTLLDGCLAMRPENRLPSMEPVLAVLRDLVRSPEAGRAAQGKEPEPTLHIPLIEAQGGLEGPGKAGSLPPARNPSSPPVRQAETKPAPAAPRAENRLRKGIDEPAPAVPRASGSIQGLAVALVSIVLALVGFLLVGR